MSGFSIDFQWLSREYGDAVDRATLAEITITAGGANATEVLDRQAKTIRPCVRVSALALARWFASNWWRLLWEPERNTPSWKMSHKIGAAGDGYLWPDLTFISDGETILARGRSSLITSEQPIRYLNSFDTFIPFHEFETAMHSFMEAVIGRLTDHRIDAPELDELWNEVLAERRNPQAAALRKLEAIMGYDPDEAPEHTIKALQGAVTEYGAGAVEEMAAESGSNAIAHLEALWGEPRRKAAPLTIPRFDVLKERMGEMPSSPFPWQRAEEAARIVREAWSLPSGPISTSMIEEILSLSHSLEGPGDAQGPMSAGFRNGVRDSFTIFLKSPFAVNRRFALMRLIGDHLITPLDEKCFPSLPVLEPHARNSRELLRRNFCVLTRT